MVGVVAGCGERGGGTANATAAANANAVATATATAVGGVLPNRARQQADLGNAATATERVLGGAPIATLRVVRGAMVRRGTFEVTLAEGEGLRAATLELALVGDPVGYRRALAFYRLARGIGATVVPITALRRIGAGELAAVAGSQEALALVGEARVQNDGTVDALLATHGAVSAGSPWEMSGAVPIDPEHGREAAGWERWSWSATPAPGEDSGLLRGYLEMLALDYLSGNGARRGALRVGRALVLADNASAFPPRPDGPSLDRLLRRLRAAQRFPRGLRDGLLAFDRERAAAAFAEGGFDTWLLSPRTRLELDERRAALLTLIEARIGERGADAALSL